MARSLICSAVASPSSTGTAHATSGNELREHGYVEQQVGIAALGRSLLAVDIDKVGYGLESIEADAYRKRDARHGNRHSEVGKGLGYKRGILEHAQYQDVDSQSRHQSCPVASLATIYGQSCPVVGKHAQQHEENIDRLAPGVEDERECHKNSIAAGCSRWHAVGLQPSVGI